MSNIALDEVRPVEAARGLPTCDLDHETTTLVERIHDLYPEYPREELRQLAEVAFAELASARVQTFRSILAERAVRRRLDEPDAFAVGADLSNRALRAC